MKRAIVSIFLANAASVDSVGLINTLGQGWNVTGPSLGPHSVIAAVHTPPEQGDRPFSLVLRLVDDEGKIQSFGVTGGPAEFRQMVSAGAPESRPSDMPGLVTAIINVGASLPLEPGSYYRWIAEVDGETRPEWSRRFYVRRHSEDFPPSGYRDATVGPAESEPTETSERPEESSSQ